MLCGLIDALAPKCSRTSTCPIAPESHLGYLHTPVEEALGVQIVRVLPQVLQQGAVSAELGDQLQALSRTDSKQTHNIWVIQTSHKQHVLRTQRYLYKRAIKYCNTQGSG